MGKGTETTKLPLLIPTASLIVGIFVANAFTHVFYFSALLLLGITTALTSCIIVARHASRIILTPLVIATWLAVGYTLGARSIHKAEAEYGMSWKFKLSQSEDGWSGYSLIIRTKLADYYTSRGIKGDEGDIIKAMTIGHREHLSQEIKQSYSFAGVSHMLAISGFHIGLILLSLRLLLQYITGADGRHINMVCVFIIWFYAFITGLQPSVVRTVMMFTFFMLPFSYGLQVSGTAVCVLSAFVMLVYNPVQLFSVGFQLSYIATASIFIVGIPSVKWIWNKLKINDRMHYIIFPAEYYDSFPWSSHLQRMTKHPKRFFSLLSLNVLASSCSLIMISASCSLAVMPVVSCTFGYIPVLSLLSCIPVTVLGSCIVFLSILWWCIALVVESVNAAYGATLFCPLGVLAECMSYLHDAIGAIMMFTTHIMNVVVSAFASLPFSVVNLRVSIVVAVLTYAAATVILYFIYRRQRRRHENMDLGELFTALQRLDDNICPQSFEA